MSNWVATNELRYVKREFQSAMFKDVYMLGKILQQKWELNDPKFVYQYEWRDLPVVEEKSDD